MTNKHVSIKINDKLSLNAQIFNAQITSQKLGTLIYFHGGGLIFGDHNDLPIEYIDVLTEKFDVLTVNYRLIPESTLDNILEDIKAIYLFAKTLNDNIYVFGRSAGGFLSYLTAKHYAVKGAIIFYGYYHFNHPDFKDLPKDQTQYGPMLNESIEKMNIRNYQTTSEQPNPRFLLYLYYRYKNIWTEKLQVNLNDETYFLNDEDLKNMPQTFLVHADNDPDVPYQYSKHATKLIPISKLITLNKNVHDFDREFNNESLNVYKEAINFFN